MGERGTKKTEIIISSAEQGKSLEELLQNTTQLDTVSELIKSKLGGMKLDDLAYEIGISYAAISKIVTEKIRPRRDVLLAIAFVLRMNVEEVQQLLKSGQHATLTSSNPRDIVIIHGKVENMELAEINKVLTQHEFKPLTSDTRTF
jgi:transcriptional regulator with XRE-family HTH domain